MYFKEPIDVVRLIVENTNEIIYGQCCCFIPFKDNVGAKLYFDERIRDASHYNQAYAESFDLAPGTGEKFEVEISLDNNYEGLVYGYFTEVLQIPNYRRLTRRTCSKLKKRYLERGIELHDIHSKNVGILGGKLVMIDFDPFSFIVKNKQKEMYPETNSN